MSAILKTMRRGAVVCLMAAGWLCCRPGAVSALAPHQVALLINSESENSVLAAREYAAARGIPALNMITVAIPETYLDPVPQMPAEQFTQLIWEPASRELSERELTAQILAWVYSVDFPLRITGDPPLSLTGLTFLRNRWPDAAEARDGRFVSPLYAGPDPGSGAIRPPATLDYRRQELGHDSMPLPAALLGYAGPGGNTLETVLRTLRAGSAADSLWPDGTVYFVTSADIRSRVRQWQFEPAAQELARYDLPAVVTSEFPAGHTNVLGLLAGAADPDPKVVGRFAPGAFAEHLTSFSAGYDTPEHTKMTAWTAAGASASAGVVTEPRAYWTKFPTARFFVFYAAGCTLLESFYQAVRCPLQSVLIGDPLMRPFGPPFKLAFDPLPRDGRGIVSARMDTPMPVDYKAWEFWLNDRLIKSGSGRIELDTVAAGIAPGSHRLRVVSRRPGRLRHPLWAETQIQVQNAEAP